MIMSNCSGIIVDDNPDAVDTLAEYLEFYDISVVGKGYDGEEAYQLFKKLRPKFVILDMTMPKYDGAYAIKKIRAEDPDAKIIVVTGYSDYKFDKQEVVAVFEKPYKMLEIVKLIEEIC